MGCHGNPVGTHTHATCKCWGMNTGGMNFDQLALGRYNFFLSTDSSKTYFIWFVRRSFRTKKSIVNSGGQLDDVYL